MSQAPASTGQSEVAPVSRELNKNVNSFDGGCASIEEVIEANTDLPPEEQRGRPVLSKQVPLQIGEALLTTLPMTPLYRYSRGSESTTAWRVGETTQALIRCEDEDRGVQWDMLPAVGEAQLDLRWMMLQSLFREIPFAIDYLSEGTVRSILRVTQPNHRVAIEQLLGDCQESK
ncbi:hypothetical protein LPA44_13725 [Halobacterium sp. KA-4]|uniref:hypothetical protein n=1 Tax=Halobacterium sp. KA-4 TaxID=2896367 RepID=UPI001E58B774|nr:hypothetical protein [Halobacterium sp. KA-4]MCD2200944.1 hypothetical protein [Halobacterium sp. KA-4]